MVPTALSVCAMLHQMFTLTIKKFCPNAPMVPTALLANCLSASAAGLVPWDACHGHWQFCHPPTLMSVLKFTVLMEIILCTSLCWNEPTRWLLSYTTYYASSIYFEGCYCCLVVENFPVHNVGFSWIIILQILAISFFVRPTELALQSAFIGHAAR